MMHETVLFLDIDGVLNNFSNRETFLPIDSSGNRLETRLSKDAINLVNHICDETGAKVVISSSWREFDISTVSDNRKKNGDFLDLRAFLRKIGLTAEFHEDWRTPLSIEIDNRWSMIIRGFTRGTEIQKWVEKHPEISNFVILDDVDPILEFGKDQREHHLVHVNPICGLTDENAKLSIKILKN